MRGALTAWILITTIHEHANTMKFVPARLLCPDLREVRAVKGPFVYWVHKSLPRSPQRIFAGDVFSFFFLGPLGTTRVHTKLNKSFAVIM